MREGWTATALKEVCSVDKAKHNSEPLPYVGLEHIESGTGRFTGSLESASVKSATFRFTPNHVLYGRLRPYLNKVLLPDFDGHCSSEIFPLRVKSGLDRRFLYYWLTWEPVVEKIDRTSTGARMPRANVSKLLEFEIALPPLPEQKRIVAILDEAFAGIATAVANTEKNLANARELFESYLNSVFVEQSEGWTKRPLNEVCTIASKLVDPRDAAFSDLKHVGAGNIVSMTGELIDVKTAKEECLKSGKFLFDQNVVLYSKIRPYLMKVARPDFSGLCSADIYPLVPQPAMLDRNFLYYLLLSKRFTDFAIAGSARAGMPKVNRERLFSYEAAMPGIEQQRSLVNGLDSVACESRRLESMFEQKLNVLAELKQSLLARAFSGELTATPVDEIETALA